MERTNLRTMYRLSGDVKENLSFSGEVTKYDDGRVNLNGTFTDKETNNTAYGSYSEDVIGNVNYSYNGNKIVVEEAKVELPILVEGEREFVATLNA